MKEDVHRKKRTQHEKTKTEREYVYSYINNICYNLLEERRYKHIDQRAKKERKEEKIVHHHEYRRAYNDVDQSVKNWLQYC